MPLKKNKKWCCNAVKNVTRIPSKLILNWSKARKKSKCQWHQNVKSQLLLLGMKMFDDIMMIYHNLSQNQNSL